MKHVQQTFSLWENSTKQKHISGEPLHALIVTPKLQI